MRSSCDFSKNEAIMKQVFLLVLFMQVLEINAQQSIKYLALGDSYTIGESVSSHKSFPHQLAKELALIWGDSIETTVAAKTGWRTDELIQAIETFPDLQAKYDLVSLLIGVNNQFQGRPFQQYEFEFQTLLNQSIDLAGGDNAKVVVISIPDYYYTPFGVANRNETVRSESNKYNSYAQELCDSLDILFVNITDISRNGIKYSAYIADDGLHPSAEQYAIWVAKILYLIKDEKRN